MRRELQIDVRSDKINVDFILLRALMREQRKEILREL